MRYDQWNQFTMRYDQWTSSYLFLKIKSIINDDSQIWLKRRWSWLISLTVAVRDNYYGNNILNRSPQYSRQHHFVINITYTILLIYKWNPKKLSTFSVQENRVFRSFVGQIFQIQKLKSAEYDTIRLQTGILSWFF